MIRFKEVNGRGFGCFFRPFKLDLDRVGLALIMGANHDSTSTDNNGSGKTTCYKALTWALFGEFVDGDKTVEVIHKRAKSATVTVIFMDEEDGVGYCVTRSQNKSAQTLKLEATGPDGWVNHDGRNKRETQAKINAIIGMDFNTWCNTVLFAAGAMTRFTDRATDDAERKRMFKQIFGLGVIDTAKEIILEESRALNAKRDNIGKRLLTLGGELRSIDVEGLRRNAAGFESAKAAKLAGIADQIKRAQERVKAATPSAKALQALEKKLAEAQAEMKTAEDEASGMDELEKQNHRDYLACNELRKCVETERATLKALQRQLEYMGEDKCPVCTSPLTSGAGAEHRHRLLDEYKAVEKKRDEFAAQLVVAEGVHSQSGEALAALTTKYTRARELSYQIKQYNAEIIAHREAQKTVAALESQVRTLAKQQQQAQAEPNPYKDLADIAESKANALVTSMAELKAELGALDAEFQLYEFWHKAFSDQGLISFIIDSELPTLNRLTNQKLQTLSDGDIMVTFDTESLLRSGELRDKFSVNTLIEGMPNATPSTAQGKKLALATALAFMDMVANRQDKSIDIQLLDEPFDGLDKIGKQRAIQLIQEQQANKGTIFVTSHDPDVVGAFTRRIMVVRKNGESTIKQGAA